MKKRITLVTTALLAAGAVVAGCAANPGPPPVVTPSPEPTTANESSTSKKAEPISKRSEVTVGVEALRNGLNPHLLADESSVVRSVARLVLPSVFEQGELNTDVMKSAEVVEYTDAAMTVRYVIQDAAQWSDGTPLTGSDFKYLWLAMTQTPGVLNPGGYEAISAVRVSGANGKTVDVDFAKPVAQWQELFQFLVPSHLIGPDPVNFRTGMRDDIPASAGRYMVVKVDRGRGTVTLNRNDRFWGADPAKIDIVNLGAVRSTTQSADQLRAGQLNFVDMIPEETTRSVYELVPEAQIRMIQSPRTLGLSLSTTSPLLEEHAARVELRSLIDVPLIARISVGRSTDIAIAESAPVSDQEPEVLPETIAANRPLRIAADPADPEASAAVRSLVDSLVARGVDAEVVSTDMNDITRNQLPAGDVDAVVTWDFNAANSLDAASQLRCPSEEVDMRSGNLSGYCTPETEVLSDEILAGTVSTDEAHAQVDAVVEREVLWVPFLHEQRLLALGSGIVGPDPKLENWTEGLASAAIWTLADPVAAGETNTTEPVETTKESSEE
ncbi:ABC transporter family substrate-binding protein [Corynebacterium breve]|uniref:ABC transporter family substrate-binding protein n=1 Tax=Corynebacterium breve TaxID=3049799 RepID=A0ABY8VLX2_9CORY|nr:ABC transporter family substrate-binding protein [Corynebacterium breve]WIM68555.1 ABC transporter family substrate-binding protein [Corynebacterium breve]